jgi:hypothetical protein
MAQIRIPSDATPFLPLVSTHRNPGSSSQASRCFETYADLAVFLAAYGFAVRNHELPAKDNETFLDQPGPIDIAIFAKSDRRFPPLLFMALAATGDQRIVRNEDEICRIAELFAAAGSRALKSRIDQLGTPLHLGVAHVLETNEEEDPEKI